jgi:hypothetical protein
MSISASAELNVIKSVQINSSSQSIAGTLRAPKSSLLAMVLVPLARGSWASTPNPALGSVAEQEILGSRSAVAGAMPGPADLEKGAII